MTEYNFFIDTGGTFTDCMGVSPNGNIQREKILSSSALRFIAERKEGKNELEIHFRNRLPDDFFKGYVILDLKRGNRYKIKSSISSANGLKIILNKDVPDVEKLSIEIQSPEEAPVFAIRLLTKTPLNKTLPKVNLRLSTTKGTNALLERKGAKSLLIVTKGFADILHIRNQQRPDLFALNVIKSDPFYDEVLEVDERLDAKGNVLKPLNKETLKDALSNFDDTFESVGVCFMHSYCNPMHERVAKRILSEVGFKRISCSSDLSASIKYVTRCNTTDINSFLAPVMHNYFEGISNVIGKGSLKIMSSAGNLTDAKHFEPKDGLLSGPAGGVVGAAAAAISVEKTIGKNADIGKVISFDMGGTSTDVARFDGEIELIYEHKVGDALLNSPAVDIETVAAGGGSICKFDGRSIVVGPESAGADPGPACYGKGGPLTITDVNLLLGKIHPQNFGININTIDSESRFKEVYEIIKQHGFNTDRQEILMGFLDIANERMAQTIRKISIQKGFNPTEYTMVAFGGAGAQHALAVAGKLGIDRVIIPSDAGLLSAYGLMKAKTEAIIDKQILESIDRIDFQLVDVFQELIEKATKELINQGVKPQSVKIKSKNIFLRFKGQDSVVGIEFTKVHKIVDDFNEKYKTQYGHLPANAEVEVESVNVIATEIENESAIISQKRTNDTRQIIHTTTKNKWHYFRSSALPVGSKIKENSVILDPFNTIVIDQGWNAVLLEDGNWLVEKNSNTETSRENLSKSELIELQLYMNRFTSVAEQMGEMLRKTSLSVNVKERLDFSCALLDKDGYLIVNAPHIPVHLGAMGSCVRSVLAYKNIGENLKPGDVLITNHPSYGGSHLPDVTVITPVFYKNMRVGFVASRAHHAEIGGSRPGSMPPNATTLAEEGAVIPPMFLAKDGTFCWDELEKIFTTGTYPTRNFPENLSDIQAAVSANHNGAQELLKLIATFSETEVVGYMNKILDYASQRLSITLNKFKSGEYKAEEFLDDGSKLCVTCTVNDDNLRIDFSGTSGINPGNLNANPSIVNSVIMYVLRLLIDEPLPLNDGLLKNVDVVIPLSMLNPIFDENPEFCPAVVGGNTETSQRLTDTLLKAFEMAACSYGSMSNVLFGNKHFGYYETVAGGTGAGDGFNGSDAVHQHMTNTRAADPEILELRYPVRLDEYSIRKGSGGKGKYSGGNGIVRKLTFLEPVELSVLTQHRIEKPYGLHGGNHAKTGEQWIIQKGIRRKLNWKDQADLNPGDRFELYTPGGGGYGNLE